MLLHEVIPSVALVEGIKNFSVEMSLNYGIEKKRVSLKSNRFQNRQSTKWQMKYPHSG